MPVNMMHVRHVRVRMPQWLMPMGVRVRLSGWNARPMLVLMVRVVHMRMRVLHQVMSVLMPMILCQMQPDTGCH